MKQVCIGEGTDKCLSSARHFRRTLVGIANQQTTLCICPVVPSTMREIQNVVCLDAFPLVPLRPHSRQPSLRDALLGVATGEVSQAEESARTLSGRYSLGFLLVNPLPCHSLRPVPRVWDGRKGQHQRRSRRPWGNWRNLELYDWRNKHKGRNNTIAKMDRRIRNSNSNNVRLKDYGIRKWCEEEQRKAGTTITKVHWCIGMIRQTMFAPFRRTNGGDC